MNKYTAELKFATAAARQAGEIMLKYFDGDQEVEDKHDGSPVTIADKLINSQIIESLRLQFPDDGLIGEEESTTSYGMGKKWFCDPIDGTKAYTWGVPTAMFSLGLIIDGQPQMGVAYDPFLDRMYWAIKGEGSYCNGQKLRVNKDGLDTGVVAVSSNVANISRGNVRINRLVEQNARLATFSGAVYKSVLVARGKFAGYVEEGVNAHDMAAVQVIVEEAGGLVTGLDGQVLDYSAPFKGAIVSNGRILI